MVIFIQYAFTDLRRFTDGSKSLLLKPAWPLPSLNEFQRNAGAIVQRTNSGIDNWIGEHFICKIKKGIRLSEKISVKGRVFKLSGKHSFSSEGFLLNKYEFVFTSRNCGEIDFAFILELIESLLNADVAVRIKGENVQDKLKNFHEILKDFHVSGATRQPYVLSEQKNSIVECSPQIYIHLDKNEEFISKKKVRLVNKRYHDLSVKLFGEWVKVGSNIFRIWVHKVNTLSSLIELNRELRISILRLHSEYACLNNVLNAIKNGFVKIEDKVESDILQAYLNSTITNIFEYQSVLNSQFGKVDFLEYFNNIYAEFNPGQRDVLKNKIQELNFRLQIQRKVINYVDNQNINIMTNITNSQGIAVGDNAKVENNTFNQINYSVPSDLDYNVLQTELDRLKVSLKDSANEANELMDVANVAAAHEAAKSKDGNKVVESLKKCGKWVGDVATKLGVNLVTELIKQNGGFGL